MLLLKELELVQFRNYHQQKWQFNERIVCIGGYNGVGKTNLLDAIYFLGFSKSYFSRTDAQNVQHGQSGMRISGDFLLQEHKINITSILRENNRKELLVNQELIKKMSDHVGRYPCVMIAPDDIELISGTGEGRRKMIDTILCQTNKEYLYQLISYTKVLQQRNSFLKQAESGSIDQSLLQILNQQLINAGNFIHLQRSLFLQDFIPSIIRLYTAIAGKSDYLNLAYQSELSDSSFETLLNNSYQKDILLQRTTKGIHRDDLNIQLEQYAFKSEASQGQRKSLLFAIKLAEWDFLHKNIGFEPILLLDDVFEKLDEKRMYQLLERVCSDHYGQVFITDTHAERLQNQLMQTGRSFQLIKL